MRISWGVHFDFLGETLESLLNKKRKMSVRQAFPIVLDTLHALEGVRGGMILRGDISLKTYSLQRMEKYFSAARVTDAIHGQVPNLVNILRCLPTSLNRWRRSRLPMKNVTI